MTTPLGRGAGVWEVQRRWGKVRRCRSGSRNLAWGERKRARMWGREQRKRREEREKCDDMCSPLPCVIHVSETAIQN